MSFSACISKSLKYNKNVINKSEIERTINNAGFFCVGIFRYDIEVQSVT